MTGQRPVGVTLAAIWFLATGTLTAVVGGVVSFAFQVILNFLLGAASAGVLQGTSQVLQQILFIFIGVILIASGLGYWVTSVGLLQAKEWSRIGSIAATAGATLGWFAMGVAFLAFWTNQLMLVAILCVLYGLINALPILYLATAPVREYVGTGHAYAEALTVTSAAPQTPPPPTPVVTAPPPVPTYRSPQPSPRLPGTEVIGAPEPPSGWLVARGGKQSGREFGLQRGHNTIGRDGTQCDIVLDDSTISKRHADVRYEDGQFVLYDLASTNGTFVNDHRVQRQGLLDGDVVRLGGVVFVFKQVKLKPTG